MTLTLREATLDDAVPATRLLRSLGLALPEGDDAARAHWARLWRDNPAMALAASMNRAPSLGWTLEDGSRLVGFFGNIPIAAAWGTEPVLISVASQWGVLKEHRADTPRLADAYFGQQGADVLLVTSAIAATGRIFERHGGARVPVPEQDRVLFWICRSHGFLSATLRKLGAGAAVAGAAGLAGAPVLDAGLRILGRHPARSRARLDALRVANIGESFDDLWLAAIAGPRRLRSVRDAAHLRWHFGALDAAGRASFLVARSGDDRLAGYAALVREDVPAIGLTRLRVADLLLRDETDGATLDALLRAAVDEARGSGCDVLEIVGFPPAWREEARTLRPLERSLPTWPAFAKPQRADLVDALREPDAWSPTPYEGDGSLF